MPAHKRLGKVLGTFQLSRLGRGSEDFQATLLERIDNSCSQRRFGANDRESDAFGSNKIGELVDSARRCAVDREVGQPRLARGSAITGGDKDPCNTRGLEQAPGNRVFPPTPTDNQNFQLWRINRSHRESTRCAVKRGVGIDLLHVIQIFEDIEQFLHPRSVIAGKDNLGFGAHRQRGDFGLQRSGLECLAHC